MTLWTFGIHWSFPTTVEEVDGRDFRFKNGIDRSTIARKAKASWVSAQGVLQGFSLPQ